MTHCRGDGHDSWNARVNARDRGDVHGGARVGDAGGEALRDVEHGVVRVGEGLLHMAEIQIGRVGPLDIRGRAQVLCRGGDVAQRRLVR